MDFIFGLLVIFGIGMLIRHFWKKSKAKSQAAPQSQQAQPTMASGQTPKFCPNCGVPTEPGSAFCGGCGAKLN